ncbi:alpha/beta hydrolase family protein [Flavobacterium urocaniciphilum]|uniref:Pimeloyl-ACP methyl ester carboxylesterase n=1 Tax=Flavobacterium urocaniciphilum TaxID=1299341 RepID=A0A1H9CWD9_9FLAO|nr:alpha/beta hydrolase [Flavobacterium urocaniciphilum]SEQ05556.1 Pimeloyl-ACP methyl ester carboxylesterase [Flavobacterium urocaniciphilum]
MSKIPVYFVPGLAASVEIFEYIKLPEDQFEVYFLEWILPKHNESIQEYAKRMCEKINHENIVLIGVSFGGIMVQEMAAFVKTQKVIIISSVKSNQELPIHMKLAKATKFYKVLPTSLLGKVNYLSRYVKGRGLLAKRVQLYNKYLYMKQTKYLDWAIENVLLWQRSVPDEKVIHIHGNDDMVFPISKIKNCIVLEGGTHIMIVNRHKWFNENLPKLILE